MHLLALLGSIHALQKLAPEAVVVALDESMSALPRSNPNA
jgi:hypothetical protein